MFAKPHAGEDGPGNGPSEPAAEDITVLLNNARGGDRNAESRLMALVYDELRRIAAREFQREHRHHTLQTTALVHEAYLKLFGERNTASWKDRAHFFAAASQVMRHILVDHARANRAWKRGGGVRPLQIEEGIAFAPERLDDLLVLEDALVRLEQHDARVGRVVVLRFYGGLNVDEIASVLQTSPRTVKRDWNYGRAWLKAGLRPEAAHGAEEPGSH